MSYRAVSSGGSVELCEVPSPAGALVLEILLYIGLPPLCECLLCNLNVPLATVGMHSSLCAFTICTPGMCIYYYNTIECAFNICTPVPQHIWVI